MRLFKLLIVCLSSMLIACGGSGTGGSSSFSFLSIFAGNLNDGNAGFDGTGSEARFYNPRGVATDAFGNVYVADYLNNTIRKITPAGVVTTLAGTASVNGSIDGTGGQARFNGSADGTGATARFNAPIGVATDASGNVYAADYSNNTIRKITPAGVVTTLAGTVGSSISADGTGSEARFGDPNGVTTDADGNLYVADASNHTIRKITPAGVVTTLAGKAGLRGSDDGTGAAASFNFPRAVATDASGNVYVADSSNNTIRKITPAGVVTTLAGIAGFRGSADGTGASARFDSPYGVATDADGNVYVADSLNNTIRKITPAGVVTTLAGTAGTSGSVDGTGAAASFNYLSSVATDAIGNVYATEAGGRNTIRKITPAGVVTTLAGTAGVTGSADGTGAEATFYNPSGVATDAFGNVYVADASNQTIRKITPAGVVITLAGTAGTRGSADGTGAAARFDSPYGVATDAGGNVYVSDRFNGTIRKISPAGVVTTFAGKRFGADGTGAEASFDGPRGLATDASGNVYVADQSNNTIRKITPAGVVTTLAGTAGRAGSADGTGAAARFSLPSAVATDADGNVYVVDRSNHTIRKITPAGVVTTLAGTAGSSGSADGTGAAARFNFPLGVATDVNGNVYVADQSNNTIRKITPAGVVTTLAGTAGTSGSADGTGAEARFDKPEGVATDVSGNVYVADINNDTIRKITPAGVVTTLAGKRFGADGTGAEASFDGPRGVATDSGGNVFVADRFYHTIRKITPTGVVTTLAGTAGVSGSVDGTGAAARFNLPYGVATDASGNVYVADQSNNTIRKITPAGVVTTLAGTARMAGSADGTGAAARFSLPSAVATDADGNVYVVDRSNHTIRKITPAGVVTTLAGTAGTRGSADGTGAAARFNFPLGVATDVNGNVYVADQDNSTIRKITPAGVVTTLAGTAGTRGSADGTGAAASFNQPRSVATDTSGNVYVTDTVNSTIRKITPDGVVTTLVGTAGRKGFQPGVLPGGLSEPSGIAVHGSKIYFSDKNGIGVIN